MQNLLKTALAAAVVSAAASAQFSILTPPGYGALEGNSNNAFPWNRNASSMHCQFIHDSTQFSSQSVTFPVLINRLRYRRDASTTTIAGGSWPQVQIKLATCTVDHASASSTFANNLGSDVAVVHNGQVTVIGGPGNGAGVPGPFYIDIPLPTPFLYDPNGGDLVVDIELNGAGWSGTSAQCDHVSSTGVPPPLSTRVYDSTSGTPNGLTGTVGANYGPVCEFSYVPAAGLYAGFTSNVTGGATPLAVQFTDATFTSDPGGVTSWSWDLDGDAVADSALQNPSFTYNNCGSYNVSLTVTDATHAPSTLTRNNYIVTDQVTADFTYQVLAPYLVLFTDLSAPTATSWAWDFDNDNVIDSTSQNPVHVYPNNTGLVPVRLTASRLCGAPHTVTKNVLPTLGIQTILTGGNGLSATGAGNCFDITVSNPLGINITSVTVVPWSTTGGPVTCDIYLTDAAGGYASNHTNAAVWRLVATGSGTASISTSSAPVPCSMTLNTRIYIPPGAYAMAIHMNGSGIVYTTGTATNVNYSNADVAIACGNGKGAPFNASANTPRVWNGILFYDVCNIGGLAGRGFFGAGCPSSMGISRLTSAGLPMLGSVFTVDVNNMPTNAGMLAVGYSNTVGGFGPLPFDLTPLGLPGCHARVSTDIIVPLTGTANVASLPVPIPNSAALMCVQLYAQALVVDPAANTFGGVVSDAMAVILGN